MEDTSTATLGSRPDPSSVDNGDGRVMRIVIGAVLALIVIVAGFIIKDVFITTQSVPRTAIERDLMLYQDMLSKKPNSPEAHRGLAQTYLSMGSYPKAIAEFKEAIRLNPKEYKTYNEIAIVYQKINEQKKAIAALQTSQKLQPNYEPTFFELGKIYYQMKKYDLAEKSFTDSLAIVSSGADTHYYLGKVYEATARTDQAIAEYNEALKFIPDYPEATKALAALKK